MFVELPLYKQNLHMPFLSLGVLVQIMNGLADKYADRPFSYLWVEGGAQLELESALEVGG